MLKNYKNKLALIKKCEGFSVWLDLENGNRIYSEGGFIIGEDVRRGF